VNVNQAMFLQLLETVVLAAGISDVKTVKVPTRLLLESHSTNSVLCRRNVLRRGVHAVGQHHFLNTVVSFRMYVWTAIIFK